MNKINLGFLRIAFETATVSGLGMYSVIEKLEELLEPYNLSVWDSQYKVLNIDPTSGRYNLGYVDVHVCEQELFGDQPIRDLLESIAAIEDVAGVVFIDTESFYQIPIFKHQPSSAEAVVKAIKRSFIEEVLETYKQLLTTVN